MNKINDIKFTDIIITTIISVVFTLLSYSFLYKICHYKNLYDFYSGITIYNDHNKFLDICIYFLYLLIFFAILIIETFIKSKLKKDSTFPDTVHNFSDAPAVRQKKLAFSDIIQKIKNILLKYQYTGIFGFAFIHPLDGNFYTRAVLIILILSAISIIDVYRRNKNKDIKTFSPFIVAALLFCLMFSPYNLIISPTDNHHFGEKFAVFFMHNNFNLSYYKDLMLVHGITDIIPSWLGAYIFNQNNVYGYCLGEVLYRNLLFIFLYISGLYIFKKNPLFIVPLLLIKVPTLCCMFICSYLIIIKKSVLQKPYLCMSLYILLSFIFISLWTTIGSFWAFASIPLLIYAVIKSNIRNFKIALPLILIPLIILLFNNSITGYLYSASDYIKGSLFAFGNDFDERPLNIFNITNYTYKMFVLLFLPVLIIQLIKQFTHKEKNTHDILFLSFTILFPLSALSYMLGRVDGMLLHRLEYFSLPYLLIILPYFLCDFHYNKIKKVSLLLKILLGLIIFFSLLNLPDKINSQIKAAKQLKETPHREKILYNTGDIILPSELKKMLVNIKNIVYKNGEDKKFFDLTNSGMLYLYLNKKIPIKYVSFYNSVSTRQSNESAEKIKKNPPDIILIKMQPVQDNLHKGISYNIDRLFPSLRVNSLYREILLSGKYSLLEYKENVFLIKNKNNVKFSNDELKELDEILSNANLNFLPEVWANSINTLPVKKITPKFYSYIEDNKITVKFYNNEKVKDVNLLMISVKEPEIFNIKINNSQSELKCKSKTGKVLIPLDNFPSWLLNENFNEITITAVGNNTDDYNIEFYTRD